MGRSFKQGCVVTNFCLECRLFGLASSSFLSITGAESQTPDLKLSARKQGRGEGCSKVRIHVPQCMHALCLQVHPQSVSPSRTALLPQVALFIESSCVGVGGVRPCCFTQLRLDFRSIFCPPPTCYSGRTDSL